MRIELILEARRASVLPLDYAPISIAVKIPNRPFFKVGNWPSSYILQTCKAFYSCNIYSYYNFYKAVGNLYLSIVIYNTMDTAYK